MTHASKVVKSDAKNDHLAKSATHSVQLVIDHNLNKPKPKITEILVQQSCYKFVKGLFDRGKT